MEPLYDVIRSLGSMPFWRSALWVIAANVAMFGVAVVAGEYMVRRWSGNRITPGPGALSKPEVSLAAACVVLNGLVAVAGVVLWREGVIDLRPYGEYSVLTLLLDALVLFIAMDSPCTSFTALPITRSCIPSPTAPITCMRTRGP